MCEFEQNRSKDCQTNNQHIQLNPSQLQEQLEQTAKKRLSHDQRQNKRYDSDKNDKMTDEPLTLSDYFCQDGRIGQLIRECLDLLFQFWSLPGLR